MFEKRKKTFAIKIRELTAKRKIPEKLERILLNFHSTYKQSIETHDLSIVDYENLFLTYLDFIVEQLEHPFSFEPYHERITHPYDYYTFGVEFLRPLIDIAESSVLGEENLSRISAQLNAGENVILFANHQTEADPQAISVLLDQEYPEISTEMIFVAGERVLTDPLAIPFSMGRNLLCIYSKRYIDFPPEDKHRKQLHNKKTMQVMSELLKEGKKCIYVAPSGGRDRPNEQGVVEVAPFDPQSIEMFYLMAKKASHPTHFYPLALATYDMLPPPNGIQTELGEARLTKRGAIHLYFGEEIDMGKIVPPEEQEKQRIREKRAEFIWNLVKNDYAVLK
jgi:glycerol-3-phosphate O-acyltransferase